MTKPRPTISLFTKKAEPGPDLGWALTGPATSNLRPLQIPIRTVSRKAIEQLVESLNRSATHAD